MSRGGGNKFTNKNTEALLEIVKRNIDILILSETKIDNTFPVSEFIIKGYNDIHVDHIMNGGRFIIYIRKGKPCVIEGQFVDQNLFKSKWLLFGWYNPEKRYFFLSWCNWEQNG